MKVLHLEELHPQNLEWLISAVEGKPSNTTGNARFKGRLLIELADMMDAEEEDPPAKKTPRKKGNLKGVDTK